MVTVHQTRLDPPALQSDNHRTAIQKLHLDSPCTGCREITNGQLRSVVLGREDGLYGARYVGIPQIHAQIVLTSVNMKTHTHSVINLWILYLHVLVYIS